MPPLIREVGASKFSLAHYLERAIELRTTLKDNVSVCKMAKHSGAVRNWVYFLILKVVLSIRMLAYHAP